MSTSTDTATTTEDQQTEPTPVSLPEPEIDKDGWVHDGHPANTECNGNCYQTPPTTTP